MIYQDVPAALAAIDEQGFAQRLAALRLEAQELDAAIADALASHEQQSAERQKLLRDGQDPEAAAAAWLRGDKAPPDTAEIDRAISAAQLAVKGLRARQTANSDAQRAVMAERLAARGAAFHPALAAMASSAKEALERLRGLYADAETIRNATRDGEAYALAVELGDVLAAVVHRRVLSLDWPASPSPELAAIIASPPMDGAALPSIPRPRASY